MVPGVPLFNRHTVAAAGYATLPVRPGTAATREGQLKRTKKTVNSAHPFAGIRLVTVREVAEMLRLTDMTIYRMVDRGVLPAIRLGRSLRFDAAELREWLRASGGNR